MQDLLLGGKVRKIPAVGFLLDVRYNGVEAILSEDHCCQVVWVSPGRVTEHEIENGEWHALSQNRVSASSTFSSQPWEQACSD